ncbi:poly(ADP-ribose) glycohydrolase-like isoform X2 [Clavelina lepadiformis]|uniref:poly(ADP-ribose) glycohydrolase n=1 Tax=Clavelina lepadiformis TaxID=159417 RepID=A0ABP0EY66_CLALP
MSHKNSEPQPKRLKQLSILEVFAVHSQKRSNSFDTSTKSNRGKLKQRSENQNITSTKKSVMDLDNTEQSKLLQALDDCEKKMDCLNADEEQCLDPKIRMPTENVDSQSFEKKGQSLESIVCEEPTASRTCDSPLLFESQKSKDASLSLSPTKQEPCWLGTAIKDLQISPTPLRPLEQSQNHTVLFGSFKVSQHESNPSQSNNYIDAWDGKHVRLPCSPKSLYPIMSSDNGESLTERWGMIEAALLIDINSSIDLEEAILTYNSRNAKQWSFKGLHSFFAEDVDMEYRRDFFEVTLPKMIQLALRLPFLLNKPIPLLTAQKSHKITMTQQQIACLLCNAFLCTFPRRNSKQKNAEYVEYPDINFNRLFAVGGRYGKQIMGEKLKTLLHYFKRVTDDMPGGNITFERRALDEFPHWSQSPCELFRLHVNSVDRIENAGLGMLQVDFANKFIGGGVLGAGMVQEEIRFCICPELIISRLFTEKMHDNECVVITGVEQFSRYSGYAETYKWDGNFLDTTESDKWGRRRTKILAIDAIHFRRKSDQFTPSNLKRELNKAFSGFMCNYDDDEPTAIATGNWGCGAFGGDPLLKGLLQLMAAAAVGRDLCYFSFHDSQLMSDLFEMYTFIKSKKLSISNLWYTLTKYNSEVIHSEDEKKENLLEYLHRLHSEYDDTTDEEL